MKKKNMKPIVLSALLALSFGAVSVGTTFALFTDVAEANVAVKAGEVKVTNEIQILEAKSLNDHAETVTDGTDVTYINGGTANVDNTTGKVTISRWTPGDSVTLQTTPVNGSNVKTKMRLRVVMSGDLAPALKVTGIKNNTNAFVISGKKTYCTAWTLTEAGVNPDAYDVKIEFPDSDNGEILFGSENKDNKYQGKEAEIHIYYEAVQGNAAIDDLLERVNSRLAEEEIIDGKANDTMHEAFADLEGLLTPADAKSNQFVWNYETDTFARETAVTADQYKYFKVADDYVTDFSMYASEAWTHTDVALTGLGFDAGAHTNIASITYTGAAEARENIIRTNSANTTLTIDDASTGTIYHYGSAGALNIIQCHTGSYHENGKVAYAEIAKGRIVLEKGADVEEIHINKKENEQAFDTVIIANNGGAEELPERITRDAVEVSSQTLVVKVESNGSSENVYVYANGTTGTTEKVTEGENKQNEAVNSALGQLVLDNGSNPGEKAQTAEQKAEAKQEVVETAIEKENLASEENANARYWIDIAADEFAGGTGTESDPYLISSARQLALLSEIMAGYNTEKSYSNYCDKYYKLTKDIDLAGKVWISIGIGNDGNGINPFKGHIDGNNKTVYNMSSLDATYEELEAHKMGTLSTALGKTVAQDGFVGYAKDASVKNLYIVGAVFENSKFEKSGFVVCCADGNIVLENCYVDSTSRYYGMSNIGGLIGIYKGETPNRLVIKDCTVSATIQVVKSSNGRGAGFVGAGYKEKTSCYFYNSEFNGEVKGDVIGGFIGRSNPRLGMGYDVGYHFVNCNMYGKLTGTHTGLILGYQDNDSTIVPVTLNNCKYKVNGEGNEIVFSSNTKNLMSDFIQTSAIWLGVDGVFSSINWSNNYQQGSINYTIDSTANAITYVVVDETTLNQSELFDLSCTQIIGNENAKLTITSSGSGDSGKNRDITGKYNNFYTQDGKLITKLWTGNTSNDGKTGEWTHTVTFKWDTDNSRWILAKGLENLVTVNE